jgi:hypothetical protein
MTFHYVHLNFFEPHDYHCPYFPKSILILLLVFILDMMMMGVKIIIIWLVQVSNADLSLNDWSECSKFFF